MRPAPSNPAAAASGGPASGRPPPKGAPAVVAGGRSVADTNLVVFGELLDKALGVAEASLRNLQSAETRLKPARILECEEAQREATTMRRSFAMELSLVRPQDKAPYRQQLEVFDKRAAALEQQLKFERATAEKTSLLGGKTPMAEAEQRDVEQGGVDATLKATKDLQVQTTKSLKRSVQSAAQTRDLGREIADTLQGQGEQIARIEETATGVDNEIVRANQILLSIARRMATDKVVLCFGFLLFGIIIAVIVVVVVDPAALSSSPSIPTVPGG